MKLGVERFYGRRYESGTKTSAKRPLTEKERKMLIKTCLKKCVAAYVSRMTASGLLNPMDSIDDLKSEAWLAMNNILDKFDKAKCGKITKFDVPGKDKPKSLEFYFYVYFCGRVNWMAVDTRGEKKKRGMTGPQNYSQNEISYDPQDEAANPEASTAYDSVKFLMRDIKKQPMAVQSLFEDVYVLGTEVKELKTKYPDYLKLRRALSLFVKDFQERNSALLKEEVPGFKEKRRGRRS